MYNTSSTLDPSGWFGILIVYIIVAYKYLIIIIIIIIIVSPNISFPHYAIFIYDIHQFFMIEFKFEKASIEIG